MPDFLLPVASIAPLMRSRSRLVAHSAHPRAGTEFDPLATRRRIVETTAAALWPQCSGTWHIRVFPRRAAQKGRRAHENG